MSLPHVRKLLAVLASSAWLPVVVSCDPGDFRIVGVPADVVIVDEGYYDDCCGWWGDFHFDWWDDDDD